MGQLPHGCRALSGNRPEPGFGKINTGGLNVGHSQKPAQAKLVHPYCFDANDLALGIQVHG